MYFRPGEPVTWYTNGNQVNPAGGTVLATVGATGVETGQTPVIGNYMAYVIISSDAASSFNVQWRNAADNGNVNEQRIFMNAASGGMAEFFVPMRINNNNEYLRVTANALITGNACASIYWQRGA